MMLTAMKFRHEMLLRAVLVPKQVDMIRNMKKKRMRKKDIVELAARAVSGDWARVEIRRAENEYEGEVIELLMVPNDLFRNQKKMEIRFGTMNDKEVFVVVAGGMIPKDQIEVGIKHAHRFNQTSPEQIKVEIWSDGDMTVRTNMPLPDGTESWNRQFNGFVRKAAEAIARIDDIDWGRTPVPRVGSCTPERILYEVSCFGMPSEYLAWIVPDGGLEVRVDNPVHASELATHRPRFDEGGFAIVWETHCDDWRVDDLAAALAFVNRYNAGAVDAVAFLDEKTRRIVWRRAFRRMPSNDALFETINDGCEFFVKADKELCGEDVVAY